MTDHEAQIKLKECISRLNQPEYKNITWSKDELVLLLKDFVADNMEGVERSESKRISSAGR